MFLKLNDKAFTLLELLLALAIFMIVVGAIYSTYLSQQKSYLVQEQVAGIQQNLRAAMFIMSREIRIAGYSSKVQKESGLGITAFGDEDGRNNDEYEDTETDEDDEKNLGVQLAYMREPDGIDNDENGTVDDEDDEKVTVWYSLYEKDNGVISIGRELNGGNIAAIADNIDQLHLTFRDSNNNTTSTPGNVESILITIVGRSDREDLDYTHQIPYDMDGDGTDDYTPPADHYRRRMLSTVVKCRNLGLN